MFMPVHQTHPPTAARQGTHRLRGSCTIVKIHIVPIAGACPARQSCLRIQEARTVREKGRTWAVTTDQLALLTSQMSRAPERTEADMSAARVKVCEA